MKNNHAGEGEINLPNSKTCPKATVIFKMSNYQRKKQTDQRNRIKSSERDTCKWKFSIQKV